MVSACPSAHALVKIHTKALDDQGSDICCNEDASIPRRLDQGNIFSSSKPNGATKHHVDCCCKEQRADEEEDALHNEGSPRRVVHVGTDP
jgi:hypothetical protein